MTVKLADGHRVAPSRRTFEDVSREWLSTQTGGLRSTTKDIYETLLTRHVFPRIGRVRIQDVSEDVVAHLLADLRDEAGLAPGSIRATLTPLSRVLGYAARRGLIVANAVRGLDRGERPKVERRGMRLLDPGEIERLLARSLPSYRALLTTAVFTGLRQGELLGLTWADVDLDAGFLHVRKQLARSGERVEPKTPEAVREVDLFPALVNVLRAHREAMFARGFAKPTDYVFTTEAGRASHWRNVSARGLGRAVERAGLDEPGKPSLRFHDLRHTYASMLIGQGEDVTYVAAQLGHASPKITLDVYARLFDRQRRAEQAKARMEAAYGRLLGGSSEKDAVVSLKP